MDNTETRILDKDMAEDFLKAMKDQQEKNVITRFLADGQVSVNATKKAWKAWAGVKCGVSN